MKHTYKVYVSNPNGWERECPDSAGVFFGDHERYIHRVDGGMEPVGHVVVSGYSEAVALRDELNRSGDWECEDGRRPVYAIARYDAQEARENKIRQRIIDAQAHRYTQRCQTIEEHGRLRTEQE